MEVTCRALLLWVRRPRDGLIMGGGVARSVSCGLSCSCATCRPVVNSGRAGRAYGAVRLPRYASTLARARVQVAGRDPARRCRSPEVPTWTVTERVTHMAANPTL